MLRKKIIIINDVKFYLYDIFDVYMYVVYV